VKKHLTVTRAAHYVAILKFKDSKFMINRKIKNIEFIKEITFIIKLYFKYYNYYY